MGESGGDVEKRVAQRFRLAGREDLGIADQGEQAGSGDQIGSDRDQRQPGLVDRVLG